MSDRSAHARRLLLLAGSIALAFATGCWGPAGLEGVVQDDEAAFARKVNNLLHQRNVEALRAMVDSELLTGDFEAAVAEVLAFVPEVAPTSSALIDYRFQWQGGMTFKTITVENEYVDEWLLVVVATRAIDGKQVLSGLHVYPQPASQGYLNRFTLAGKGLVHILVLNLALLVPAFIIFSLVQFIRTPAPSVKWLWILFIVVAVGQFDFNWTSGVLNFKPLSFQLFGAGFLRSGVAGPIHLHIGLPIGGVIFLLKRRRWVRMPAPSDEESEVSDS